ncbi:MAG: hypothetical protein HY981_03260, partial [Candidatus Magasanikbacteria bacterium]|nr:hypothetical protein [Candidatus Magasanikbacteria bacterium]
MKTVLYNLLMIFSVGIFLSVLIIATAGDVYAAKINQSTNARNVSGLKGLWSFDNQDIAGTDSYDRSTSFATGTITGTSKVAGRIGQALKFNNSG